jgi:hypothetical protein
MLQISGFQMKCHSRLACVMAAAHIQITLEQPNVAQPVKPCARVFLEKNCDVEELPEQHQK